MLQIYREFEECFLLVGEMTAYVFGIYCQALAFIGSN